MQVGALSFTGVAFWEFFRTPTNPCGSFPKLPRARFCVGAIYTNYQYQLGCHKNSSCTIPTWLFSSCRLFASNPQLSQVWIQTVYCTAFLNIFLPLLAVTRNAIIGWPLSVPHRRPKGRRVQGREAALQGVQYCSLPEAWVSKINKLILLFMIIIPP